MRADPSRVDCLRADAERERELRSQAELSGYSESCRVRETTALIASGWCCGAEARTGLGVAVEPVDRSARAWSLRGALALVCERSDAADGALRDALWGISGVIDDWSLDGWNDAAGRTQDASSHLNLCGSEVRVGLQLWRNLPPLTRLGGGPSG